ncbi:MAG TPA: hypothetical protein DCQ26_12260 [Marinilabiliales bacterium]|jgi:predicted RNA-binding Zn-ribbon protein involved in translation (DUF1610 family)|nr:MAG: hypothetical protein A2W95_04335 [Bacteroidetes bacterium GWA2_40_14]OFX60345.1 MAG: hypothetical protein A2W84_08085 [Bacteroidetes bacterium GWC2_40_13]OFX76072.1 MAG: hypothetical protein A2W96_01330 [Bacteroidetes bacterium GWD2_40_43]OFX94314.1 MAG: hypothetical protein A2W97_19290 [Bacteroidetes bacterium GWE2_40_63]OFY18793.1 MAG: hypothetical protein A2W88_06055 [Bacteroidetes bacterium GWF2_40_13]OFZ24767.1 MAG: hypothetical protein A2437_15620 [Bacteroidetes bacterium RIFOXYC
MKEKYICPKCRNSVNIGNRIILTGKTRTGLRGMIMIEGELGNYNSSFSDDFTIIEGNRVKFICPICHSSLSSWKRKNLAHLIMVENEDTEAHIYFSQIYGEKCAYKVIGKELIGSFGEHKDLYKPDWLVENL